VGCLAHRFPFEGLSRQSRGSVAGPRGPLMGLVALQSLRHRSIRRIGLPVPTSSSQFPTARWFSFGAGPRPLSSTGCSSLELYLLFRDMLPSTCSSPEGSEHLPGFPSPSRHQPVESTSRRASQFSPTFRPQRFARSRRLAPPRTLQAYFILLPRPGFASQGFSPLPSRLASSTSRTLLSFAGSLLPMSCPTGARFSRPAFRALIRAAIRCDRQAV
jgi:hypothetical protein